MSRVLELFGISTETRADWQDITSKCWCPYLNRLCLKNRKSRPDILIGTCSVSYGKSEKPIIICPHRLLERKQIFTDCIHLLTLHEPGNEFHIVPEVSVPGGSIDYFLVSANKGKVKDFAGIELQTMDTTGTVWPERQRFLQSAGIKVSRKDLESDESFGMNWKMTAKTILMQLHHKVETFESLNKHLVLVLQSALIDYMSENFSFAHVSDARVGDVMHFHGYGVVPVEPDRWQIDLEVRRSTDSVGVAKLLGLQAEAKVELEAIVALLEERLSKSTLFDLGVMDVTPQTRPS